MGHVLSVVPETLALLVLGSAFFVAAAFFRRFQQPSTPDTKPEFDLASKAPLLQEVGPKHEPVGQQSWPQASTDETATVDHAHDCVAAEDVCT